MTSFKRFPAAKKGRASAIAQAAFTILELLVAMTILAIIVGLIARVTSDASRSITGGEKRLDADSEARVVLDRIGMDLARMPKRADLIYSFEKRTGDNDRFAFFSEAAGVMSGSDGRSAYSTVCYDVALSGSTGGFPGASFFPGMVLGRAAISRPWHQALTFGNTPGTSGELFPPSNSDYSVIGDQVFRFEYTYLLKPASAGSNPVFSTSPSITGTTATTGTIAGFKDVAAIVVGIGILDRNSRQTMTTDTWAGLVTMLPDAVPGQDILSGWNYALKTTNMNTEAKRNIRVYQRYFYLNAQ